MRDDNVDYVKDLQNPELIALCTSCQRDNCNGLCLEYRNTVRRMHGLPLINEPKRKPKTVIKYTDDGKVEAFGEAHTISEWARLYGIKRKTLHERIYRGGMTIERALTKPVKGSRAPAYIEIGSKRLTVREWANETGVPMRAIYARLARGYSPAEAVGLMPNERLRLKRKEG